MPTGDLSVIVPRRLQAPQEDRAILAQPPLADAGRLLADNRQRLAKIDLQIFGRAFTDLQRQARAEAVTAARDYLGSAGEPVSPVSHASLLMAGHQPELFHPGVWVKHFALHGLARAHDVASLNLVVDNDTAKQTGLLFPSLESHTVFLPYDQSAGDIPFEERHVLDETLFADFPGRAAAASADWGFAPLLPGFWKEVLRQAERTTLMGERLAAARRSLERSWGCHNLEVPVSALCRTEAFAWLACHLLANLPRFHDIHNTCLREYRQLYGMRSRSHPVPDLAADGDWLEVPLWAWRSGASRRGRLLARLRPGSVELRAGDETWPALPLATADAPQQAVAAWLDLQRRGLKIRSRALTNTLYARLFLADLFIHGIGGAKYDELTDEIVRRFYGFEPPRYLTLSATLLLPLPILPVAAQDCRKLAGQLRDVHYNPQRHLDARPGNDPRARDLAHQKQEWIARRPATHAERRTRFEILKRLTNDLRPFLADREAQLRQASVRCDHELQINSVRRRRDYAFCLFPETALRPFCTQFLSHI
jgi:hypothetical protein